jgi:hypothetical protein
VHEGCLKAFGLRNHGAPKLEHRSSAELDGLPVSLKFGQCFRSGSIRLSALLGLECIRCTLYGLHAVPRHPVAARLLMRGALARTDGRVINQHCGNAVRFDYREIDSRSATDVERINPGKIANTERAGAPTTPPDKRDRGQRNTCAKHSRIPPNISPGAKLRTDSRPLHGVKPKRPTLFTLRSDTHGERILESRA